MSTSTSPGPSSKLSLPLGTKIGLGVLIGLMLLGAITSGITGAAILLGLALLMTGLWHAAVGRSWLTPLLPQGRKIGVGAIVASVVAMGIGGAAAPPIADPAPVAIPASPSTSPSPSPTPSPTPSTSLPSPTPVVSGGTAMAALAGIEVKGRAPQTGYDRDQFGQQWADADRNGCDTRNDVLRRDLTEARTKPGSNGCSVVVGTLADPFTGTMIEFVRGTDTSQEVHIDHVVALSDAWQKGAQQWDQEKRTQFANDPLNLLAVQGAANQQKSDGDAATWLPANKAFRCDYVARQVAVKAEYGLWVTQAEHDAIEDIFVQCPDTRLPTSVEPPPTADSIDATPAPATSEPPPPVTTPAVTPPVKTTPAKTTPAVEQPKPTPPPAEPVAPDPVPADVYYKNCTAARDAGAAPILEGEPGYRPALDRDKDGIACDK